MDQWTALLISLSIEVPIAIMFAMALRWASGIDLGWLGLVAMSATCLSQPAAWFVMLELHDVIPPLVLVIPVWLAVVAFEALAYWFVLHLGRRRALALALTTNIAAIFALVSSAGLLGWVP